MSDIAITIPTPLYVTATMEGAEINIDLSYSAVTVDSEMSDLSENPVQNKVIKAYVDQDKISIGRLDIDHTDTTFVSGDLNTYMEVDDTGGEVTLDIPDSFGNVGDVMIVRKIGDANDLIITAAGSDLLVGGNKVETQYHIIHLYKVTATRWNATGGVE